jgi:hypothetical protein
LIHKLWEGRDIARLDHERSRHNMANQLSTSARVAFSLLEVGFRFDVFRDDVVLSDLPIFKQRENLSRSHLHFVVRLYLIGGPRDEIKPHNYNVGGLFDAGPSNNVNVRLSRETTISEDSERQTEENEQKRFHGRSVTESILHGKKMRRVAQRLRDSQ